MVEAAQHGDAVVAELRAIRARLASIAADTGVVINPVAHRGQIEGGFAQGLGAALMEELLIEEGVVATQTLADYRLPAATDVPAPHLVLLTDAPGSGAFGAKMAGELSPSTVAPAIANAVAAATGVWLRQIPMTPERVLAALRQPATALSPVARPAADDEPVLVPATSGEID